MVPAPREDLLNALLLPNQIKFSILVLAKDLIQGEPFHNYELT